MTKRSAASHQLQGTLFCEIQFGLILADTTTPPRGSHQPRLLDIKQAKAVPGTPVCMVWAGRRDGGQGEVQLRHEASAPAEPVAVVATNETSPPSEAATVVGENLLTDQAADITGSVQPAATGAAILSFPKVEIYEEPAAQPEE